VHGLFDAQASLTLFPGTTDNASSVERAVEKISSVGGQLSATSAPEICGRNRYYMKAKIIITPKKAVLDPQGKTVQAALEQMGYGGIRAVHVGKYLEIELNGDPVAARQNMDDACHKFLSNPVIEDYKLEIE